MADKPSSFSSIIVDLEWSIQFAYFICCLAGVGLGLSFIPLPRILEESVPAECAAGLDELQMVSILAFISLCLVTFSVMCMGDIKVELSHLFREEIDAKMSQHNAVSLAFRWSILLSHAVLVAGIVSAGLSTYYAVQLKSRKFGCMGVGTQIGLIGFLIVMIVSVMIKLFRVYRRTFVELHVFPRKLRHQMILVNGRGSLHLSGCSLNPLVDSISLGLEK